MQIRCQQCHKPFGLSKEAVHQALDAITAADQAHFNVRCPHCGRTNKAARDELLRAAPDWNKQEPASAD